MLFRFPCTYIIQHTFPICQIIFCGCTKLHFVVEYIRDKEGGEPVTRVYYIIVNDLPPSEQSAMGRALLRYALHKYYGISDTTVAKTDRGKPYLADYPHIHVNITHTDTLVAVAVSDSPVGVDAQTVTDKIYGRVAKRMFTAGEREYAAKSHENFYEVWTKKESFVKMTGEGLSHRTAEIDVLTGDQASFRCFSIDNAVLSVCMTDHDETELTEVKIQDLK